jgi:hypothetical protein
MAGKFDILIGWVPCTIILMIPNVVMQLVTIKCTFQPIPFNRVLIGTFITDGLVSLIIVCVVIVCALNPLDEERYALAFILLIAAGIFYFFWIVGRGPFCCQDCCTGSSFDRLMVYHQLRNPIAPPEEGIVQVAQNAAAPPLILVTGWAGHDESYEEADIWERYDDVQLRTVRHTYSDGTYSDEVVREVTHINRHVRDVKSERKRCDRGGGHFSSGEPYCGRYEYVHDITEHTIEVTTWSDKEYYRYTSWQDTSHVPPFPDVIAITVVADWVVQATDSARAGIDAIKTRYRRIACAKDTSQRIAENVEIPAGVKNVTFALDEAEVGRIRKYFARWWGILAWFLCFFFGFQSAYECFCSLGDTVHEGTATAVHLKHVKVLSGESGKRCPYNVFDEQSRQVVLEELIALDLIQLEQT